MAINYFPHEVLSSYDIKIEKLEIAYGMEGKGIFWTILEKLGMHDGYMLTNIDYLAGLVFIKQNPTKVRKQKLNSIIRDFGLFLFTTDEDGNEIFYSERLLGHIEEVHEKSEKSKKAANVRHGNLDDTQCECNANALPVKKSKVNNSKVNNNIPTLENFMDSQSENKSSDESSPLVETEEINQIDLDFKEFWETYPKKEGKDYSEKAYKKARKRTDAKTILNALKLQIEKKWANTERQFIPLASSWLNQARWNDEIADPNSKLTVTNLDDIDLSINPLELTMGENNAF